MLTAWVDLLIDSDGRVEGENGLRRVREEGQESRGRHERSRLSSLYCVVFPSLSFGGIDGWCRLNRSEQRRDRAEAEKGHGDRVRGPEESDKEGGVEDGEEGGAVAVRAVRRRGPPLRAGGLWQEGAARVRAERGGRPRRGAARPRKLHGGEVHDGVQRRQPQLLCYYVKSLLLPMEEEGENL